MLSSTAFIDVQIHPFRKQPDTSSSEKLQVVKFYSPAAHFKARPSLVNLLVNGHVKGAWLGFR